LASHERSSITQSNGSWEAHKVFMMMTFTGCINCI
jgi:hypothetical protein